MLNGFNINSLIYGSEYWTLKITTDDKFIYFTSRTNNSPVPLICKIQIKDYSTQPVKFTTNLLTNRNNKI